MKRGWGRGGGGNEPAVSLRKENFTLYQALTLVVLHSKGLFRNIYLL